MAGVIIHAARREGSTNLQEQLDYALSLESWSWIARECGVQLELIDVLADAGADAGTPESPRCWRRSPVPRDARERAGLTTVD